MLRSLTSEEIVRILSRALRDPSHGLGSQPVQITDELLHQIALFSNGDARAALQTLETAAGAARDQPVTAELLESVLQRKVLLYDKAGEEHYNLISALHKSIRSSDPDAALYWLGRMLEAGEDRIYIGRRLVRMAVEDIGLADPRALEQALAAVDAFRLMGEPEGDLALAQAAVYLAVAPKSDAVYSALGRVQDDVQRTVAEPVPMQIRNAPTALMRNWGYSKGYEHAHHQEDAITDMECLPESLRGRRYYLPTERGREKRIAESLEEMHRRKAAKSQKHRP
jgi:putative ATPase